MEVISLNCKIMVVCPSFQDVAIKTLDEVQLGFDLVTKSGILLVQDLPLLDAARPRQLLQQEAKIGREDKRVLVREGGLRHQDLVLLVNAGRKAGLNKNSLGIKMLNKDYKTILTNSTLTILVRTYPSSIGQRLLSDYK